jgi:hypothetical protein
VRRLPRPTARRRRHLPPSCDAPESRGNSLLLGGTNANTNAAWIASNPARLPAGTIGVTYDIKSVSVNEREQPVMVFRMLQDGQRKDLNDFTPRRQSGDRQKEIWDNFMGAPSLYFVFAVPQDGLHDPGRLQRHRQRLPADASGIGARPVRGGHADRARRRRVLHRDAHRVAIPPTP